MLSLSVATGYGTASRERAENATTADSKSMKQILATLTLGSDARRDVRPLLLEQLPEDQLYSVALLDGLNEAEIRGAFGAEADEKVVITRTPEGKDMLLSLARVEEAFQEKIVALEAQGFETILLLGGARFSHLKADRATLLEPYRLLPSLVNAITGEHQVGIVIAREENLSEQRSKWRNLVQKPHFAIASPWKSSDDDLVDAALTLQEKGADVLVLDCLGYHQRHRDFLQKLLGIPVLLSNMLLAKLAAELLL
uniref:AroM family protein n=1 Tax=Pantoea sp. IMH TaxID=1267600 RepID=UPI0004BB63E1|nr:AroM family protein [Pantoea sp. IMH]